MKLIDNRNNKSLFKLGEVYNKGDVYCVVIYSNTSRVDFNVFYLSGLYYHTAHYSTTDLTDFTYVGTVGKEFEVDFSQ